MEMAGCFLKLLVVVFIIYGLTFVDWGAVWEFLVAVVRWTVGCCCSCCFGFLVLVIGASWLDDLSAARRRGRAEAENS